MPHRILTEPWWTPWPGIGPGRDLLGDLADLIVLELGCGNGANAAAFAHEGATVTGIDRDLTKIDQARRRWNEVPRLRFDHADAIAHLAAAQGTCRCRVLDVRRTELQLTQAVARPDRSPAAAGRPACDRGPTPPEPPTADVERAAWSAYTNSLPVWRDLLAERGLHTTTADVLHDPTDANAAGCAIIVACHRG